MCRKLKIWRIHFPFLFLFYCIHFIFIFILFYVTFFFFFFILMFYFILRSCGCQYIDSMNSIDKYQEEPGHNGLLAGARNFLATVM